MKSGLGLIFLIGALALLLSYGNEASLNARGHTDSQPAVKTLGLKQATLAAG